MRLRTLLIAAILLTGRALQAQPAVAVPSTPERPVQDAPAAPSGDAAPGTPPPAPPATPPPALPVSLDNIREGLSKPAESSMLRITEFPADFRIEVVEQRKIDEMLSKLDFSSGPVPAGGLYAYEQQRRLFRPTDRPLMQPYAAFNGGQLITVALENLIIKYLGGRALNAVSGAERARAERQARDEVDRAILDYCAARSDRRQIQLCTDNIPDR